MWGRMRSMWTATVTLPDRTPQKRRNNTLWRSATTILGPVELALGVGWVSALDTSKHWGKWLGRMTLIRLLRWLYCQPYCQSNLEGGVIDSPSAFFSGPIYVDPKTTAASLISIYGTRSHTRHFSV